MGTTTKIVNLALQGGGAHGAFTWGVLNRLLEGWADVLRGNLRGERRRHECYGHGIWPDDRRTGGSETYARKLLAAYQRRRSLGTATASQLDRLMQSTDVIVIHINPIVRETVPRAASDILNRLNEISFNSSLMREMRAIAFANKLVNRGALRDEIKTMLIHAIEAESFMKDLGVASKYNADWIFLLTCVI